MSVTDSLLSATSLSSETIFASASYFFIDANFVVEKWSYSFPKLSIIRNISYIKVIKVIFLCYSNCCNKKVSLFVISLFKFLIYCLQNLLRNFARVIIAFRTSFVTKKTDYSLQVSILWVLNYSKTRAK